MNKVITINLSGRLITIDEEAYQQLNAYLTWLKQFFSKEEGGLDIYSDMEDRIAELFDDKLRKNLVSISTEDVQAVIKIMGSPEQIAMETAEHYEEPESLHAKAEEARGRQGGPMTGTEANANGKLVRNLNDKVLGGVCSGLANYFNADPVLIRILMALGFFFYGTTVFLYILLWVILPAAYPVSTTSLKRRWYRTDEGKVLGGVCSGMSYHLRISKQWLRFLFAFPLIGVAFFNIINEDDLASFCTAALPIMTILYIVLWIALPKASTLTEKMELKGERLDVQNISSALKEQNEKGSGQPLERPGTLTTAFRILAYIVLAFLILVVGSILVGLLVVLLGVLFGFSTAGISAWPLSHLIFESQSQAVILFIAAILVVLLPIIIIIRWLVLRIKRPTRKNKWIGYSLSSLFLLSLFAVVFICSNLVSDFKYAYKYSSPLSLEQPKDTLIITRMDQQSEGLYNDDYDWIKRGVDDKYQLRIASLKILPSEDSLYHLDLERQSNGSSAKQAKALAEAVSYTYRQDSNILKLPEYLKLGTPELFRAQLATAVVKVPKGSIFKIADLSHDYSKSWTLSARPLFSIKMKNDRWLPNRYYKMGADGVIDLLD